MTVPVVTESDGGGMIAIPRATWYTLTVSTRRASHETRSKRPTTDVVPTENLIGSLT
ncbi:MAG: hypothetical protein OJF51_000767 [Nitrospira sp.]|jgi:hypothetical protein|nr:MAG: hypothetical protein OJF51_000767 [Nitrospira sp.]